MKTTVILKLTAAVRSLSIVAMTIALVACAGEDTDRNANQLAVGAAVNDPCSEQYAFQRELNGAPTDTYTETAEVAGREIITQQYWYEDTRTIVYFRYAQGEAWCNSWNEGGVNWNP